VTGEARGAYFGPPGRQCPVLDLATQNRDAVDHPQPAPPSGALHGG
jgi:hypothetical protein